MKNANRLLVLGLMGLAISGCSSKSDVRNSETEEDAIVSRIDNLDERPKYINESEPFRILDGQVISTGMTTIPGSDRVDAAFRIAQNNAKAAIAGAIEQRLEFIFQNAEEGTSFGTTQARYIGAEASKLVTSAIRPHRNYWEKVATTTDSGERITQYKIFSTVTMPEADFKRAVLNAIRNAQGKGNISEAFAKKVDAHWDQFTGQMPEKREPANSEQQEN